MNYRILILLCSLFLLQSCKDEMMLPSCDDCDFTCIDDLTNSDILTIACKDNWTCEYTVSPESEVNLDEYEGIGSGNKIVFQVKTSTVGEVNIIDDEITDIVVFELNASQTSFSVEGDQLADMEVHAVKYCFCPSQFIRPISGCIQGEMQADGTWYVQGNLTFEGFDGTTAVLFDSTFGPK